MDNDRMGCVLLTGATGLLGQYLLRDLLAHGRNVVVVVRATPKVSGHQRIEQIMQRFEADSETLLPRPVCFEGDLKQPGLGLSDDAKDWIRTHCDSVLHCAASLTFHADNTGEPWDTNVEGTRRMLDLAKSLEIKHLHYVSTAYICGLRQDLAKEDELDVGQDFRNDYERSKLQAETIVRATDWFDTKTIYRPAVVAGDSKDGYTLTYHGLYLYLRMMSVVNHNTRPDETGRNHTPIRICMDGDEQRNVIPVDWTSEVICHLLNTPESHGRTFHLVPKDPITPLQTLSWAMNYYNSYGVEFIGRDAEIKDPNWIEQLFLDSRGMYEKYEFTDPAFDATNLHQFAGHISCPPIDEAMLHCFLDYAEADSWGKRRPKSEEARSCGDFLKGLVGVSSNGESNGNGQPQQTVDIGLEVRGPGGGQWCVSFGEHEIADVIDGLPNDDTPIFRLDVDEFWELADSDIANPADLLQVGLAMQDGSLGEQLVSLFGE